MAQKLRLKKPSFSVGAANGKDHKNLKMLEKGGQRLEPECGIKTEKSGEEGKTEKEREVYLRSSIHPIPVLVSYVND